MCGACGRRVVNDPVLGTTRTIRQHLIVAQTVNAICRGQRGAPKVTALPNGWLLTGPSGSKRVFNTVEELWIAVIACFTGTSALNHLRRRQEAYIGIPENDGLPALTADLGKKLSEREAGLVQPTSESGQP